MFFLKIIIIFFFNYFIPFSPHLIFTIFKTYLRQIILSQLYFWASCLSEGSMIPPRRRRTRCRVDSVKNSSDTSVTKLYNTAFNVKGNQQWAGTLKCI